MRHPQRWWSSIGLQRIHGLIVQCSGYDCSLDNNSRHQSSSLPVLCQIVLQCEPGRKAHPLLERVHNCLRAPGTPAQQASNSLEQPSNMLTYPPGRGRPPAVARQRIRSAPAPHIRSRRKRRLYYAHYVHYAYYVFIYRSYNFCIT